MAFPWAPFAPRTGLRGMVNAADQLASTAGVSLLDHGGSAADAAVAAAAVMAVTSPHLCGLGGDMLAMISEPGSPPTALLGVGRSGSGVDAARMRAEGHSVMPLRGDPRSAPVPGAVDGWLAIHHRFGRLPLEEVLAPAIELAEEGFVASLLLALSSYLVADVAGADELCPGGPRQFGSRVRLPGVARMLRAIAAEGRDGFYKGEFGRSLLELGDGVFTPADFDRTLADWYEPVRLSVWGRDLWTVPPPSQGYLTLASSWIAEQSGLGDDPNDPSWAHLVVEASRPPASTAPRCSTNWRMGVAWWPRTASRPPRRESSTTGLHHRMWSSGCPIRRDPLRPAWETGTPPTCAPLTPMGLGSPSPSPMPSTSGPTWWWETPVSSSTTGGWASRSRRTTRPSWRRAVGRPTPCHPCWPPDPTGRFPTWRGPWAAMPSPRSSCRSWPEC